MIDVEHLETFMRGHIKEAIRRRAGRNGTPVKKLSESMGRNEARIRSHIDTLACASPSCVDLLLYMRELGPDFTNECLALIGQGGAHRVEAQSICPVSFGTRAASYVHRHMKASEDRMWDESEIPEMRKHLRTLYIGAAELEFRLGQHDGVWKL